MKDQIEPLKPPPLTIPKGMDKLVLRKGDSVVVMRADESIEVYPYMEPGNLIKRATITALGIYWCLISEDWRAKLDHKAKRKIEDIIAGRET